MFVAEQATDQSIPPHRWPQAVQEPSRLIPTVLTLFSLPLPAFLFCMLFHPFFHGRYLPVNMSPSPEFAFLFTKCL